MLDTLKYAKRLQDAGFTPQQAEAQAQALWEAIEGTVATKQDLREQETRLYARIDNLEARIDGRFTEVDGRFNALDARFEGRFAEVDGRLNSLEARFEGRFRLLYWMLGFNLALTLGVLLKLLTD